MERILPEEAEAAYLSEAREQILEIAKNRPGTQVAKCIRAYDEQQDLASLVVLLEELSKNTDYSTDLRISLGYYIEELLRHCLGRNDVSRRSAIVAAGSALQYCGKIYGDRVEYLCQVVEHQIEALLTSELQKETPSGSAAPEKNERRPEETRKRHPKKLTNKEVDPYLLTLEPKRFKTMSDDKRFNAAGFVKCTRNRTIEYLYQDHTPPNLWKHAPIVDPHNPYDQDEKKQYKMFTYHVEHRYNTLLPDIPFERLNLIKEYVHTNQVNTTEILNEHMTTKEYLDEYIALENQMLAARYGAIVTRRRRLVDSARFMEDNLDEGLAKKMCMDKNLPMDTNETVLIDQSLVDENSRSLTTAESTMGISQAENSTLKSSEVEATLSVSHIENSLSDSQEENPPLSSTLAINESSVLDSTRVDPIKDLTLDELLLIDSGISMEELSDIQMHTGQSFDDEGVVLSDLEDQRQLSPMLQMVSPSMEAKTLNIIEMDADLIMNVPREVSYPILLNVMGLPIKRLRRKCIFKLPPEFDLFRQARLPIKREGQQKSPTTPRTVLQIGREAPQNEREPGSPCSLEFDEDLNFLGFRQRRPTFDSGFDIEEPRVSSCVSTIGEVKTELEDEIEANTNNLTDASASDALNENVNDTKESGLGDSLAQELNASTEPNAENNTANSSQLEVTATESSGTLSGLETTVDLGMESALVSSVLDLSTEPSAMDSNIINVTQPDNSDLEISTVQDQDTLHDEADANDLSAETPNPIADSAVDDCSLIRDWHRRLAPALEAAHERQNFNIKDLGTEILDICKAGNRTATLADVMADKDPSIMCRYMLASLVLTNHGNVSLDFENRDKSKPIDMSQFRMHLKSMKRMEINPEDDVGNINAAQSKSTPRSKQLNDSAHKPRTSTTASAPTKRKSAENSLSEVFAKTVRLIQPIPKMWPTPSDADSGISSMGSSLASTARLK
uniref:Chromosome associated protein H2, isoform G n=1 Tax=Drosophila melanogaster TaxID=7227 RepID=A0A0C4DHE3_DROME|nr:chromosome associated protein H2, isoform G [Drosophila melanogaster]AAN13485.2 chromosome associated protein H2, isoform G [Drosophila melanogaster]|eukprot:NP_731503.2 chromosome associated protein H2, isoform G [Drosophila melanogaster]